VDAHYLGFFYTAAQKKPKNKDQPEYKKPEMGKFFWKRRKFAILDIESGVWHGEMKFKESLNVSFA
jgi:hypothetical protein